MTLTMCLEMLFPPWTVTRQVYAESLTAQHSGISNDVLLFSEVGLSLVHHYRVHRKGLPHAAFRGRYLLRLICPELGVAPLSDPGTDLEDELPSPDSSPVVIGHGVALLPAQVEEDVDLAQMLAAFGTLPAIVTPIRDPQEERVVPPAEYRAPDAQVGSLVTPAGPTVLHIHRRGRWAVRRCL